MINLIPVGYHEPRVTSHPAECQHDDLKRIQGGKECRDCGMEFYPEEE